VQAVKPAVVLAEVLDREGHTLRSAFLGGWGNTFVVPVVAISRLSSGEIRLVAETIRAGAADFAILGVDDLPETCLAVVRSSELSPGDVVRNAAEQSALPAAIPLLEFCIREALIGANANAMARRLGVSEKTLERRFTRAGLPTPGNTLGWVRLLLALERLQSSPTVAAVAAAHGYSGPGALRIAVRNRTGISRLAADKREALRTAATKFAGVLRMAQANASAPHTAVGRACQLG